LLFRTNATENLSLETFFASVLITYVVDLVGVQRHSHIYDDRRWNVFEVISSLLQYELIFAFFCLPVPDRI